MGSVEGEAEKSGLDHWKQPYCTTARPGRLAEAGFGVGGEQSLVSLGKRPSRKVTKKLPTELDRGRGAQAETRPTDCESVDNRDFAGLWAVRCASCVPDSAPYIAAKTTSRNSRD